MGTIILNNFLLVESIGLKSAARGFEVGVVAVEGLVFPILAEFSLMVAVSQVF